MQHIFTYQNSKINYTDEGNGNIVVLLHGFGETAAIWEFQQDFLHKNYRIIVPDLPGSGASQILQQQHISIDDYAVCINSLVEHITNNSQQKITLLGHSMGGYITLAFAKLFPQKLNGFGLIHSTAFADNEEKKLARLRGIEMIKEYGSYAFLKNTIPNLFASEFKQNNPQQVEVLIENGKTFAFAALEQYYIAMMNREDATNVLKNATVPVLFVMGTDDVAAPLNDVLQQCHLPTQSHIHILKNVGHIGMWEATSAVNSAIEKFIEYC